MEAGWKYRSFFTFYSEFQRPWPSIRYIEAVILSLIFIIGITGNALVIVVVCKSKSMRSVTNYFMVNLALAGISFLVGLPLVIATRITGTWTLGDVTCRLLMYSQCCCGVISICTMTFISTDRYKYISCPIKAWKPSTVKFIVAGLWITALIIHAPLAVNFVLKDFPLGESKVTICTLVWPNTRVRMSFIFVIILVVFFYLIPLVVISTNYFRILKKLLESQRKLQQSQNESKPDDINKNTRFLRTARDLRAVRMLILIVVVFCLFWLPVFIAFCIILYDGLTHKFIMTSQAFLACMCICFSNACVNPFLYGLLSDQFRIRLRRMCQHCKTCHNVVRPLE